MFQGSHAAHCTPDRVRRKTDDGVGLKPPDVGLTTFAARITNKLYGLSLHPLEMPYELAGLMVKGLRESPHGGCNECDHGCCRHRQPIRTCSRQEAKGQTKDGSGSPQALGHFEALAALFPRDRARACVPLNPVKLHCSAFVRASNVRTSSDVDSGRSARVGRLGLQNLSLCRPLDKCWNVFSAPSADNEPVPPA